MNGLGIPDAGAGFPLGDDQFDEMARLPAAVWGFDLRPYRAARVHARRKRSRIGFIAAVCGGFVGALLLQSCAQYERRQEQERASSIARQVDAFTPALFELSQWQAVIGADKAQQAWLEALAPRRTRVLRLMDLLAAATRTGVRVVDMQVYQGDAAAMSTSVRFADGLDQTASSELRLQLAGLADDADTLAQWAADLAAQPGIISVDLDSVQRLEDRRPVPAADLSLGSSDDEQADVAEENAKEPSAELAGAPGEPLRGATKKASRTGQGEPSARAVRDAQRLSAFRLTLTWRDPAVALKPTSAFRSALMPASEVLQ